MNYPPIVNWLNFPPVDGLADSSPRLLSFAVEGIFYPKIVRFTSPSAAAKSPSTEQLPGYARLFPCWSGDRSRAVMDTKSLPSFIRSSATGSLSSLFFFFCFERFIPLRCFFIEDRSFVFPFGFFLDVELCPMLFRVHIKVQP